jgi:hypothetical protein
MKRLSVFVIAFLSILVFSCKKTSNDTTSATTSDYYKLKVGNYWIYQGYQADSNEVPAPQNLFDSAYIEKDTIIRGNTYYKLWEGQPNIPGMHFPSYLRDSSGYLVTNLGYKECSVTNFKDTIFLDTFNIQLFRGYGRMTGKDSVVTVPAGNFQSITSRIRVVPTQPNDHHPVRYIYNIFGKNIGKIKTHNFYYNGGEQLESRLVRYKVQ